MDTSGVSSSLLEERVAMYLQAIEGATAANDDAGRQVLEKDIQILMDLMERVSVGQVVPANAVPPPLQVQSPADEPSVNALDELSSRLADYHKALYYADIKMDKEDKTQQIQTLQRGLQVMQKLQEKAEAGYPIRAEEIPPPVPIPTEEEFVVDPRSVLTDRIALYYQGLEVAKDDGNQTLVQRLQGDIEKLDCLLKRAENNIPIYKKDVPGPLALGPKLRKHTKQYGQVVDLLTKISGLSARAAKLAGDRGDKEREKQLQNSSKVLTQVLQDYEAGKPLDLSSCPYTLADIKRLADEAGVPANQGIDDVEAVRQRCQQYKQQALKAKRAGDTDLALQNMRVVKDLQYLLQALENGDSVDKVPPSPPELTQAAPEEESRVVTQSPSHPNHQRKSSQSNSNTNGISLAEELSAFLSENAPSPEGSSSSSSSRYLLESNTTTAHPPQTDSANEPSSLHPSLAMQRQGQIPKRTMTSMSPQTMTSVTPSSGLNPLYALTQNSSHMSVSPGLTSSGQNLPYLQNWGPTPPPVPNRALKPGMGLSDSCPPVPERVPLLPVNGFHNGVELEPFWENQFVYENRRGREEMEDDTVYVNRPMPVKSSGKPRTSSETFCIEILKYEKIQLSKEGSEEATAAAEKLGKQMEEAKQRLRVGGYDAWLVYLGQVEEDVSIINSHMKLAREGGQEEQLASLVIKKELAERELAVMRKRLPELQT